MKDLLALAIMSSPAIVCSVTAGILAFHEKQGWGWFIFGAVLLAVTKYRMD